MVKTTNKPNIMHIIRGLRCANARLMREPLYDIEKRETVFSPWAYHIIDKRIARESMR